MKSDIRLYINNTRVPVESFVFNGGESHVKIAPNHFTVRDIQVTAYIKDAEGIIRLALLKDAIDRINTDDVKVKLALPYIPFARQDRRCEIGEAFSLQVFARILNGMKFDSVSVCDPHSDVAPALIDNVEIRTQERMFHYSIGRTSEFTDNDDLIICAPDGGALKKAFKVAKMHCKDIITAEKIRCTSTGQILETKVNRDDLTGKTVWMVDDIADGAATFAYLAKELKSKGAEEVNLWVTHGIFSKGKEYLKEWGVDNVHCAFDWSNDDMF